MLKLVGRGRNVGTHLQVGLPAAATASQSIMDQPAVIAAFIAAGTGILVNFLGGLFLQWRRAEFEKRIARQRLADDMALARERQSLDQRLDVWRARRIFAEETLAAFYEAESLFHLFRSGMSFRAEAESRQGREEEPEALRSARDNYWPVLKRMDDHIEPFNRLHARRFRAMALFGPTADEPFMEIRRLHARIQTAGQALMRESTHSDLGNAPAFKESMERIVWEGLQDPDNIRVEIAASVAKAEGIFGPILRAGEPSAAAAVEQSP